MASPKTFFDLPPEIRNKIYRLIVSPDLPRATLADPVTTSLPPDYIPASTDFDLSILSVNRQISSEATDVFYRDHLFVRVRFSFDDAIEAIRKRGLHTAVRRNAWKCPWMVAVIDVDFAVRSCEPELPPTDIVLARHDVPFLTCLLLHAPFFVGRSDPPYDIRMILDLRIENRLRLSADHLYEWIFEPIRISRCVKYTSVELFAEEQDFVRDFNQLPAPFKCLDDREYLAVHRALVQHLEGIQLADAVRAIWIETRVLDRWIRDLPLRNPGLACPDWLFKSQLALKAYDMSLKIRLGVSSADTALHGFLACCEGLDAAQPTTRLLPLCHAIERYFRFTITFYQEGLVDPDLLRACIGHDPHDDLGLLTREMLETVEAGDTMCLDYHGMISRVNQSLWLSEMDELLARLYRLARLVPFGPEGATTRWQDQMWDFDDR
ncbi:MAG: hypothetical protein LQ345_006030 [Seirophora villosa]|nr:MAG: hypothetical protein LQ345_006030 [Seirophora villosa]